MFLSVIHLWEKGYPQGHRVSKRQSQGRPRSVWLRSPTLHSPSILSLKSSHCLVALNSNICQILRILKPICSVAEAVMRISQRFVFQEGNQQGNAARLSTAVLRFLDDVLWSFKVFQWLLMSSKLGTSSLTVTPGSFSSNKPLYPSTMSPHRSKS